MKTICIDARMLYNSGIGVYIRHYVSALLAEQQYKIYLIGNENDLTVVFGNYTNWQIIPCNVPIYSIKEQIDLPRLIPTCDLFWSPHYNVPILPIRAKKRLCTIADIYHLQPGNGYNLVKKIYAKTIMKTALILSERIITISEFTRSEIIQYFGGYKSKITTILCGLDLRYFTKKLKQNPLSIQQKYSLPDQYVLYVGNIKPHKNLVRLASAILCINKPDVRLPLVIVGKREGFITGDNQLTQLLEQQKEAATNIYFTGHVSDEELLALYRAAHVFAFPSLYEGFGYPPLEAMACGCPVVASTAASIPEVCGDAVFSVDPYDVESIQEGLLQVAFNAQVRSRLIEAGHERVKKFSLDAAQRRFLDLIHDLLV